MPLRGMIVNERGNYFRDPDFVPHTQFLSDEDYSKVLDNVCVTCCDIIVVRDDGRILLGLRAWEPLKDWWIQGGRAKPGESFEETCARNVKRELGLVIDPERFQLLKPYMHNWAQRRQEPVDNGSCTSSIVHVLFVTQEECEQIKPNEEYVDVKWEDPQVIAENADEAYCELMWQVAKDYLAALK
jgi:ADP-ribose pyrophosphatase YjhB (NUDIX family)